jgi:hypothetical protein
MDRIFVYAIFAVMIVGAIYLRVWQCEEMFPNANLMACLLWK